jgi:hypothetical protein
MTPAFGASCARSDFTAAASPGAEGLGLAASVGGGEAEEAGCGAVRWAATGAATAPAPSTAATGQRRFSTRSAATELKKFIE